MDAKGVNGVKQEREKEFLLLCAHADREAETIARARLLAQEGLDWGCLLQLALLERVMPLLYRCINENLAESVPAEFLVRLSDYFYMNAARNHLLLNELCECVELFEKNGIRAVTYKGAMLAANVYGDVALRQFSDLDLMIRQEDVSKVSYLLGSRGYSKEIEMTPAHEEAFRKIRCEHLFHKTKERIFLDLHWSFTPSYFPLELDLDGMWNRLERVALAESTIFSFAPEDLLLILAVNAAKDFWQPLQCICDIAEFVRAHKNLDWDRVLEQAKLARARRILFTTLYLAQDLLGANIPEYITQQLRMDRKTCALVESVRQRLFQDKVEAEVSKLLRPSKSLDGLWDRVRFHLHLGLTPTLGDWLFIKLPERARFLYYLTRPIRLAKMLAEKYVLHH